MSRTVLVEVITPVVVAIALAAWIIASTEPTGIRPAHTLPGTRADHGLGER